MSVETITNRDGQTLELSEIEHVTEEKEGYSLKIKGSWSIWLDKDEAGDFVPRENDWILLSCRGFNTIAGIIIEGRVLRAKTSAQIERDHKQMVDGFRLERLERYLSHGQEIKERAKMLPLPFRARMNRFSEEGGEEFWIDSAEYEMYALEGAAALLNKVQELGFINNVNFPAEPGNDIWGATKWINEWWNLNTEDHGYDYKRQVELVPDFGEGHSGNTAGAAKAMALWVLEGREV